MPIREETDDGDEERTNWTPYQFQLSFPREGGCIQVITRMFRNKTRNKVLLCAGTAILASMTVMAQAPGSPGGQPSSPSTQQMPNQPGVPSADSSAATTPQQFSDHAFVSKALEGGDAEVQLGQLAQEKSQSPDVKQFGQKMVQDHTQLGEQMKLVAKNMGVSAPKGPTKKDKQLMAKLQGLSGDQFDLEYIKAMVKDHKQDLKDFKDEAQLTQDPNLQQVTKEGANVINQHLQMIEQIAQAHNVSIQASNQ
jgi:putative membrane protein